MTIAVISMIRDAWGGSEELWYEMAKEALKDGHKVIHLAFENPTKHQKVKELEQAGLIRYTRPGWIPDASPAKRFIYLGVNYLRKKWKNPIKQILKHKPDVILYNGTCYSIASENQLLKYLNSRPQQRFYIIGHLNHDQIRTINDNEAALLRQAYAAAQTVYFVSERNKRTAERQLCTAIKNAAIIRNPANLKDTSLVSYPSHKGTIQFATVGNLVSSHKGQDLLLQALYEWQERNWVLNIYGTGTDKNYLQQLVSFYQLDQHVIFHGYTKDVREVWQQNHALIMPSLMEGMPLAVVEAMLCGRICIATDIGGHKEWIKDGESGYIAAAPTVHGLKEVLDRAWQQKSNWEQMGRIAHQSALHMYDAHAGATLLNHILTK